MGDQRRARVRDLLPSGQHRRPEHDRVRRIRRRASRLGMPGHSHERHRRRGQRRHGDVGTPPRARRGVLREVPRGRVRGVRHSRLRVPELAAREGVWGRMGYQPFTRYLRYISKPDVGDLATRSRLSSINERLQNFTPQQRALLEQRLLAKRAEDAPKRRPARETSSARSRSRTRRSSSGS